MGHMTIFAFYHTIELKIKRKHGTGGEAQLNNLKQHCLSLPSPSELG